MRAGSALGAALALGACGDDAITPVDDGAPETSDGTPTADSVDWSDDYGDHGDYDDYGDWNDDYSDDPDPDGPDGPWDSDYGDDDYWTPECYTDEDCGPGAQCIENYCSPLSQCQYSMDCEFNEFCDEQGLCVGVDLPAQCQGPAFQSIPLPPEAAEGVVALSFVDLDGDDVKELVLLRSDAIVAVHVEAVHAVTTAYVGLAVNGIAAADLDEDGRPDVIATSSTKQNARVFYNDGFGALLDSVPGPLMRLDLGHGIDWPGGGVHELLARNQAQEAVVLSDVAQLMPQIEALEFGVVEALGTADFDDDSLADIIALQGCAPLISYQAGELSAFEALGPPGTCALGLGDVDGDPLPDIVVTRADVTLSVVNMYSSMVGSPRAVGLYGSYSAVQPTTYGNRPYAVLAQSGGELDYVWADQGFSWCRSTLPAPPILRFAAGDSDGDGRDEIATLDPSGVVQLWSYGQP
ncbi:hypothetical protein DB30_03872 [Enhygromyxa salina]|uniref:FG-GAP repeat protein n=1 Tax=Enhygromyxa salina TaxID=215803 RepID=A0A0C2D859_9BACT|nr:hypothetical protein DB30_03872 [Enhygromyxa salina]